MFFFLLLFFMDHDASIFLSFFCMESD
jgi:hypothetical protein